MIKYLAVNMSCVGADTASLRFLSTKNNLTHDIFIIHFGTVVVIYPVKIIIQNFIFKYRYDIYCCYGLYKLCHSRFYEYANYKIFTSFTKKT